MCNLYNPKIATLILGKSSTSVQNAIRLAQKKDAELCIIEGLHSHESGHEINKLLRNKLIIKALNTAMLVVAHILYEIAMNQYAIDTDQT